MKTADLENIIKNIAPELFAYAYILIPDDLQAGQLIIDTVQNFVLSKRAFIDMTLQSNASEDLNNEIQQRLFQVIYEIAKKRYHQIKMSFNSTENKNNFFLNLEFEEKSMLYLRVRAKLEIEQIEMIMSKDKTIIIAFLTNARIKMTQNIPSHTDNIDLSEV
jgi:hypothetical protein